MPKYNVQAVTADTNGHMVVGWFDAAWTRELGLFGKGMAAVIRGTGRKLLRSLPIPWRRVHEVSTLVPVPAALSLRNTEEPGAIPMALARRDLYAQFLAGNAELSDDEDDEFRDDDEESLESSGEEDEQQLSSLSTSEDGEADDTPGLYADLTTSNTDVEPFTNNSSLVNGFTSVLLAHLSSSSTSPITRRRFGQLGRRRESSPAPVGDSAWLNFVRERRGDTAGGSKPKGSVWEDESRRNCVVCTCEPRSVICWPCRCLALCDDCRANLASRFPASQHVCPCCRTIVEGYSRIFIP